MIFTEESINELRNDVKKRMSPKRYAHTLGVENLARELGLVLLHPDKLYELIAAALLHDVAKELTYESHVTLLEASSVPYTDGDLQTKPALHSLAAVPLIERDFPKYATPDILSAVAHHTLGAPDMTIFDEIIFISDYAEEGRTYPACIEVREYLRSNISANNSNENNVLALHTASLKSVISTIDSLSKRGETINSGTLATKSHLEHAIAK